MAREPREQTALVKGTVEGAGVPVAESDTAMLDDREREVLHEIHRQLAVDNPSFGRPFRVVDPSTPARLPRHRWAYTTVTVVAALLAILMLLAGSPAGAFIAGLIAGSVQLVQYFHDVATRPEQDD